MERLFSSSRQNIKKATSVEILLFSEFYTSSRASVSIIYCFLNQMGINGFLTATIKHKNLFCRIHLFECSDNYNCSNDIYRTQKGCKKPNYFQAFSLNLNQLDQLRDFKFQSLSKDDLKSHSQILLKNLDSASFLNRCSCVKPVYLFTKIILYPSKLSENYFRRDLQSLSLEESKLVTSLTFSKLGFLPPFNFLCF